MNLAPCPFCGGTAVMAQWETHHFGYCQPCDIVGPWASTESEARDKWNTRGGFLVEAIELTDEQRAMLTVDIDEIPGRDDRRFLHGILVGCWKVGIGLVIYAVFFSWRKR